MQLAARIARTLSATASYAGHSSCSVLQNPVEINSQSITLYAARGSLIISFRCCVLVCLVQDLRTAVDMCHRDGSLKKAVAANPEKYIHHVRAHGSAYSNLVVTCISWLPLSCGLPRPWLPCVMCALDCVLERRRPKARSCAHTNAHVHRCLSSRPQAPTAARHTHQVPLFVANQMGTVTFDTTCNNNFYLPSSMLITGPAADRCAGVTGSLRPPHLPGHQLAVGLHQRGHELPAAGQNVGGTVAAWAWGLRACWALCETCACVRIDLVASCGGGG